MYQSVGRTDDEDGPSLPTSEKIESLNLGLVHVKRKITLELRLMADARAPKNNDIIEHNYTFSQTSLSLYLKSPKNNLSITDCT
ncbi:Protein of unknown function [Cotesia congregata]|uniref:Uncharacterized protein n=1 Tax=Cotesia congregata TaxID=51543 RepID=A0A8J2HF27_COTCN|nr:Protein of unknown function [Cotesia congregata]